MRCSVRFVIILLMSFVSSGVSVDDCGNGIICYGTRMIQSFMDILSRSRNPLVIFPGLEIVATMNDANETDNAIDRDDESIIGRMTNYLRHHEINIKLSDLLDASKLLQFVGDEVEQNQLVVASRKKEDKSYMMAIALMFGKLLAVFGIGSIGALAMKALGVASMALLITGLVGLKSLHQSGEETSHHVQYVSDGHHRRRRRETQVDPPQPLPLAYRGWKFAPAPAE